MIQFHVEQKGSKFVKAPSWSLGKHHKTAVIRDPSLPNAPITKIVDYFKGGQRCDENNLQRSTEVHIQCCEGTNLPNVQETEAFFADPSPTMSKATLNAIMEPEVCAYQAVVCTPYLCPRGRKDELVPSAQAQAQGTAALLKTYVDFMRHIETVCLVKQEEWWTYEVCFNKGVRQIRFNIEQTVSAEGAIVQKQVLANQYTLGSAPIGIYKNESALIECTSSSGMSSAVLTDSERYMLNHTGLLSPIFLSRRADPLHLTLTFTNGTPCDLDNLNRTTHVDISCGPTSRIVQVIEEQTCEYRIKVDLKLACNLPGFVPQKDHVTKIALELFDKLDDEEEHAEEELESEEEDAAEVTEPQPEAEDDQDEIKDEETAAEEEQQVQEEKEPVTFRFEVLAEGMTREQLTASILHSEATDSGEGHISQEEYEQGKLDRISERARIGRLMDEHPNLHHEHPEAYQLLEDSVHMLLDIDAAMDRVMEKQQKRDSKLQRHREKVEVEVSSNGDAVPVDQTEQVQVMEQEQQQEGGQKEQDDEKQQQRKEEEMVAEERMDDGNIFRGHV